LLNIPAGVNVYLVDTEKGQTIKLDASSKYIFNIESKENKDRFYLKFNDESTGIENISYEILMHTVMIIIYLLVTMTANQRKAC